MRARTVTIGLVGLVGAGAVLGARRTAARILANPDPVPLATLAQEPVGTESFVDRPDGTRIRVLTAGTGPAVVLAHGYGITLVEWNLVWDTLVGLGYRVVAFDQRGHGRSTIGSDGIGSLQMAQDYLAVMEHADVRDAVLVGHSMGGFLAIRSILDVPGVRDRLSGLVLFATFAGDVLTDAPQNRLQIPLLRSGLLQRSARNRTVGTLFGASICGDDPSPAMIRVFLDTFLAQDHAALLPILEAFGDEDRYDRIASIDVPTIVICGSKDATTPPWHSRRLAEGIPGATAVWVEGRGHMLNWESPQSLVDAVSRLAASH